MLAHSEGNLSPVIAADASDGRRMLHPEVVRLKTGAHPAVFISTTSTSAPAVPPEIVVTIYDNSGTSFKS